MERIRRILNFCFGSPNHATATATCVIALVTTVYAIVSAFQLSAMKLANDINANNTYEIQRPLLYVPRIDVQPELIPPGKIASYDINPAIFNGGNTAPKRLSIYINYYAPVDPIAPAFKFPDQDDVVITSAVAGPKDYARVTAKSFTPEEIVAFQNKDRRLTSTGILNMTTSSPRRPIIRPSSAMN
jgi:hypothetical protein